MTRLTKSYLGVLLLLGLGLTLILVDGTADRSANDSNKVVSMAGLPGPSLAVPYFESRWRMLDNNSGILFPGMRSLSTMDFVYAQ